MSVPVDHDARQRAIREIALSHALSAGAGSGKTSVLSSRVAELCVSGMPPSRIVAITFTEKAAGELESRVRDTLESQLRTATGPAAERLRTALEHFHELTISTIHSFARELLALEPLDGGWAPGTEIANEDRTGLGSALLAWRSSLAKTRPRTLELFDLVLARKSLLLGVEDLLANRDLVPHVTPAPLDWEGAHARLVEVVRGIDEARARCTKPQSDKRIENNTELLDALVTWIARPGDGTLSALVSPLGPSKSGGAKTAWPGDSLQKFADALARFEAWRTETFASAHHDLVTTLRAQVVPAILEARRSAGIAAFDDLLFRAATLLANRAIRARLASRWDALLVDEVQDTDPIQAEIAVLLASVPHAEGAWTSVAARPGALFAVGDPKQSIYRFRRADVDVWRDLERVISADGHAGSLTQNFRSVPGIVGWVSHTFGAMPGYEAQVAARKAIAIDPVVLLDASVGGEEASIDREVDAAVRHLSVLHASKALVADRETGALRPFRWGDVMVLVPRWTRGEAIATAFQERGIEADVQGGSGFFDDASVAAMTAAIRMIDEPSDGASAAKALRALFGFTLEDLARHVTGGGSLRWTVREGPPGPVLDALSLVREVAPLRSRAWTSVVDALLLKTRAAAVWSLRSDGASRLANLDKLRAILRQLEGETRGLAGVVDRLAELEKKDREDDLSRSDSDSDAVRVTSIFKAKGLEAPVVVLLDMQRLLKTPRTVVDRAAGRLHVKVGADFAPLDWDATVAREREALNFERVRWMYVACTRARDQLVIVDHPKATLVREFLEGGLPEARVHDAVTTFADEASIRTISADALPMMPVNGETFPTRDATIDSLVAAPKGAGDPAGDARLAELRGSARASARSCQRWRSVGEVVSGRRGETSGTGVGAAGGTVVHRAMELLDLTRPEGELVAAAGPLVAALAEDAGLSPELAGKCRVIVERLLGHAVLDEIRAAPEHWKETPFAFQERGRVIAGVIDLCFPVDASRRTWVVVDWKSDSPPAGGPVREKYEQQLRFYARALLKTVSPCEDVRTVLCGPFEELESFPGSADTALDLVRDAVRPSLDALLAAGAPMPTVGLEISDAMIVVELAWEEAKVCLALDLDAADVAAVEKVGYRVVAASSGDPASIEHAAARLAALLGVTLAGEHVEAEEGDDDAQPLETTKG